MAIFSRFSSADRPEQGAIGLPVGRTLLARRFLMIATAVVAGASAITWTLMRGLGRETPGGFAFPPAFVVSTLLLFAGSIELHRALFAVRYERQPLFRRRLTRSLIAAMLFVGVQSYALWSIMPLERSQESASIGVAPFAVMAAALHGLHFLVATFFVSYITAGAWSVRYDHEYHWGVTFCVWFWHALGAVWLAVLTVYLFVGLG